MPASMSGFRVLLSLLQAEHASTTVTIAEVM